MREREGEGGIGRDVETRIGREGERREGSVYKQPCVRCVCVYARLRITGS